MSTMRVVVTVKLNGRPVDPFPLTRRIESPSQFTVADFNYLSQAADAQINPITGGSETLKGLAVRVFDQPTRLLLTGFSGATDDQKVRLDNGGAFVAILNNPASSGAFGLEREIAGTLHVQGGVWLT